MKELDEVLAKADWLPDVAGYDVLAVLRSAKDEIEMLEKARQEDALKALASEGQWMEKTGQLKEQVKAADEVIKRISIKSIRHGNQNIVSIPDLNGFLEYLANYKEASKHD